MSLALQERLWTKLIRLVYRYTMLDSVWIEGEQYLPRRTMWDDGTATDKECRNYLCCSCPPISVGDDVDMQYSISVSDRDRLDKVWKKLGLDVAPDIAPDAEITLLNLWEQGNSTHRGSDHFAVELDVHPYWECNCSLDSVIEGLYRIRSHKRNRVYVVFAGVTLYEGTGYCKVGVSFDHLL